MGRLTLTVPQGVGDIYWVWQKLVALPGVSEIAFDIIDPPGVPAIIAGRADALVTELPKVVAVRHHVIDHHPGWLARCVPLAQVLPAAAEARSGASPGWAVNPWLEAGVPLERIDPSLPIFWDTPVAPELPAELDPGRYLALYVSGDTVRHATLGERIWPMENWADLVGRVCYDAGVGTDLPVVLVGAGFDYALQRGLCDLIRRRGFKTLMASDLSLARLLGLLGNAWYFLGYQSGLSILAGAAGARQHIIYFPRLRLLADTWVRPEHRSDGRFSWSTFESTPAEVAGLVRPGG